MGDSIFLVRHGDEPIDSFNERLSRAYSATTVTAIELNKGTNFLVVTMLADVEQDEKTKEVVPAGPRMTVWLMEFDPSEAVKAFNKRLEDACSKAEVTSAELRIVNGRVVVALFTETEPDPEKPDEEVPVSDLVQVRICRISADEPKQAALSEAYMEKIAEQARGAITDVQFVSEEGNDYALVVYAEPPEDDGDPIDTTVESAPDTVPSTGAPA